MEEGLGRAEDCWGGLRKAGEGLGKVGPGFGRGLGGAEES